MIKIVDIQKIAENHIAGTDLFLVEVKVSTDNCIEVLVDSPAGIDLDRCVEISRAIESALDREAEDFELTVSSAGLDLPFKVLPQYLKYIGKEVEVVLKNGKKQKAVLTAANEQDITLEYTVMKKEEGAKRKKPVSETTTYALSEIKTTKPIINF